MKMYRWRLTISTRNDVCSQTRCPNKLNNTITLGLYNPQKPQTGTTGIHNVIYILHKRFGRNSTYIITILQERTVEDSTLLAGGIQLNPLVGFNSTGWWDSTQPACRIQLNRLVGFNSADWYNSTQPAGRIQLNRLVGFNSAGWYNSTQPAGRIQLNRLVGFN